MMRTGNIRILLHMKHLTQQISLLAVSVVTLLSLAAVPVSAEHGSGDTSGTESSSGSGSSGGGSTTTTSNTSGDHHGGSGDSSIVTASSETETGDDSGSGHGSLRAQAQQLLQDKRKDTKEHTEAQRQKACEQRQKSIDTRAGNYAAAAQRHLDVFNGIFTKVQAFQASKHLSVANYDTLVAAATAKQTAAQSAVDALKALNVQIDCTQSDPASTVATLKAAVADARTALQDYRSAIKDVIVALKGASTAQSSTETTGGDQ